MIGGPDTNPEDIAEADNDVEMVQAMAPNAQIVFFSGGPNLSFHFDDEYHAMATFNKPPLTVASSSWTFGQSSNSQQGLDEMAAQGVTFVQSSGDFGDVGDPQSNQDMGNQILVGGTILSTNGPTPALPSPVYASPYYAGETTWATCSNQCQGVTGGGIMNGDNEQGGSIFAIGNCYCFPYPYCCGNGAGIPDTRQGST